MSFHYKAECEIKFHSYGHDSYETFFAVNTFVSLSFAHKHDSASTKRFSSAC